MQSNGEVLDHTTRKALIIIFALVLVFIWFEYPVPKPEIQTASIQVDSSDSLVIPSINLSAPIVYLNSQSSDDIQMGLSQGVVHIMGSVIPGQVGDSYFIGNSSSNSNAGGDYDDVFNNLPNIKVGDDILIQRDIAQSLIYQVIDIKIVASDDSAMTIPANDQRKLLTLQTSDPSGSAVMKYLVIAELK